MKNMKKQYYLLATSALLAMGMATRAQADVTVYRAYNPGRSDHHYTASKYEYDVITAPGREWKPEGVAWYAPDSGQPLYRLYNRTTGDHHYTLSAGERDFLTTIDWNYEGVSSYSGGSTPVYRLYNPALRTGSHHYTTSVGERNILIRDHGWKDEGIGWYVVSGPGANPAPAQNTSAPQPTTSSNTGKSHTFTQREAVRNSPSTSAPAIAYYEAGQKVNYDKTVEAEGHTWASYVSSGGVRRYVVIKSGATEAAINPSTGIVPNSGKQISGSFTVSQRTAVTNEPSVAAPAVAHYEAGQKVNYDSTIEADGYTWASYVSSSGVRRYVIMKASTAPMPASNTTQTNTGAGTLHGRAIGQMHKLNVPQYFQSTTYHCAPTTVSMMLASRGVNVDHLTLGRAMGTALPFGTHNADAIRVLNRYLFGYDYPGQGQAGYRLETVRDANAALSLFKQRVMQNIKDGYPMYYTFDVSMVYPGHTGEHNVVGTGYIATPDGKDIAFLTYNDPSFQGLGLTYQGTKIITPEALLAAMTGPATTEPMYAW